MAFPNLKSFLATPAPEAKAAPKLLVFDTHPIQYRSPVFSELASKLPNFQVLYFSDAFNGKKWWFHEVGKIPPQKWDLELRQGFKNGVLGTETWAPWRLPGRFKQILAQEKPAAVLVYGYYLPEHWAIHYACQKLQIPMVFVGETFSTGNSALRRAIRGPLLHYFFKGISQFIAIGDKTHAYYRSWEIGKDQITLAKYCINTDFFKLPKPASLTVRSEIRKALGIPDDAFVMLFVGRLFERKRPEDVLKVHQWFKENKKFYTVIVGNGPMESMLREQAKDLERVLFVGFKNQAETRGFYHASDVLFVPSEYETWGLVINEAAACGIPSLVTASCGAAGDLVLHGDTGFSYPVGNVPRAISFIDKLLTNPENRKKMGENAMARVTSEYTPTHFADSIVRAFRASLKR